MDAYEKFTRFLKNVYGMTLEEYKKLPTLQRNAVDVDYFNRYGKLPTVW